MSDIEWLDTPQSILDENDALILRACKLWQCRPSDCIPLIDQLTGRIIKIGPSSRLRAKLRS